MVFNSNGAVIAGITRADYSTLRDGYIVMWDDAGCPIHIKRSIIDYLYSIPVQSLNIQKSSINVNDVII